MTAVGCTWATLSGSFCSDLWEARKRERGREGGRKREGEERKRRKQRGDVQSGQNAGEDARGEGEGERGKKAEGMVECMVGIVT